MLFNHDNGHLPLTGLLTDLRYLPFLLINVVNFLKYFTKYFMNYSMPKIA